MIYNFLRTLAKEEVNWTQNTLKPHAYFVPFSKLEVAASFGNSLVYKSDRVFSLNGTWDFVFFEGNVKEIDTETADWQQIKVPSSWESIFSRPYRFNDGIEYNHKGTLPLLNESGIYRTTFDVFDKSKKHIIQFSKVGGAFQILVNGQLVGYSMLGYAEFDLTKYVKEGQNELVVAITRNTVADFYNCGEREAHTGLIGDVSITIKNDGYLEDYTFIAESEGARQVGNFEFKVDGDVDVVHITLTDHDGFVQDFEEAVVDGIAKFRIVGDYKIYSPEEPNIYDCYVSLLKDGMEQECDRIAIGFYTAKITDSGLSFGGLPLKLKAVEFRGIYNEQGDIMSVTDYISNLLALKRLNINALYLTDIFEPWFIELCSRIGLFVIQNLPVDTSRLPEILGKKVDKFLATESSINFYTTRVESLVIQSQSQPSMFIYSFGKENPKYEAVKKSIDKLNELSHKLISYRGSKDICELISPSLDDVKGIDSNPYCKTTLVTYIEGGITVNINQLNEYLETIIKNKRSIGFVVREYKRINPNAKFNSVYNENGGLTDVGTLVKYASRPFMSTFTGNRCLKISNTRLFTNSSDIVVSAYLTRGDYSKKISTFTPIIAPRMARDFDLYIGEISPNTELLIEYDYKEGGHIATETINIQKEVIAPGQILNSAPIPYTYEVKNTTFSVDKFIENALEPRAYFIPCSNEALTDAGDYYRARHYSDRVYNLNGEWDFAYFPDVAPVQFSNSNVNWNQIKLPGSWESLGIEKMHFVSGYAFDANLKKFSIADTKEDINSTGIYRRIVNIGDPGYKYILSLGKVKGSIELQINGKYVGFSLLGTAEFDISDYVNIGENEIVIIVKKWTPASYLDAGDGFACTGIVGDVNLIKYKKSSLKDYEYTIHKRGPVYLVDLFLKFFEKVPSKTRVELRRGTNIVFSKIFENNGEDLSVGISGENFIGYSFEDPQQYDIYVKVYEKDFLVECTKIKVGFNHMNISKDVVFYNDIPLKLKGITYNPIYNAKGKLLTLEDIKSDFRLIRDYGFNAIQILHYLSPEAYNYAAEIGLYIVPRLGTNTKGIIRINPKMRNAVVDNESFKNIMMARAEYIYARDKNNPAIIMYMLPEDNNAVCVKAVVEKLKEKTKRPIVTYGKDGDIIGATYPNMNEAIDLINVAMNNKPVLFCKYASGVGLGSATLYEYEDLFTQSQCCLGGFIAHFVDDYIEDLGIKDNGIFTEKRQPYPSAENAVFLYRPVKSVLSEDKSSIEFYNSRYFYGTDDMYVDVCVIRQGKVSSRMRININVKPQSFRKYDIFVGHIEGEMYLNIEYKAKRNDAVLYVEQHRLNFELQKITCPQGKLPLKLDIRQSDYIIHFDSGFVVFNKKIGAITRYNILGKEILNPSSIKSGSHAFTNTLYRPFVRNLTSQNFIKNRFKQVVRDFVINYNEAEEPKQIHVNVENVIFMQDKESYIIQDKYIVNASGVIEVFSVLTPLRRGLSFLDCFGKSLRLKNEFGNITYYGNGPGDNYIDLCAHTRVGRFNLNVDKAKELIRIHQECGNRTGVQYAIVTDNQGDGLMFSAHKTPFQLRVSPINNKEIFESYATNTPKKQSGVYVDINAFVSGIGTSYNGYPLPQYIVKPGEYILHFDVIPISNLKI